MVHAMLRSVLLSTVTLLALGCGQPGQDAAQKSQAAPAAATPAAGHAAAGVKPGSHEDWCGEHQVPESLCTRCDPSLIAAFKATGDWCPEHARPESQCLICNPGLKIVRPPPADEVKP